MRTRIIATIYLGVMAGLYGVSPATQNDAEQSGVLQKVNTIKDSLRRELVQADGGYPDLRRQLMWDQVESIEKSSNQPKTDTLDDLIRQLRSLEIPQKSSPREPNEPVPPQTDAAADSPLPEEEQADKESEEPASEDELIVTLGRIDKVTSPLQLADVLYRQGYYELAFENYCTIEERISEDCVADRQWILFQKANCRRHSEPKEAIGFYNELIKSFPNSKWTATANSRLEMIEWSQLNQIRDLVENETDDTNN